MATNPAAPTTTIQPYLFFRGRCEEAIEYYRTTFGAEVVMMMRFKDSPEEPGSHTIPPEMAERVMHACLRFGGAEVLMSDGMKSGECDFDCVSLAFTVPTEAECDRIFNGLAAEGAVQMPLGPTFFAKRFGAVADKFGVGWMILVPAEM